MKNNSFKVIGSCESGKNKNLVISTNATNDIVIAQNFSIFDELENKSRTFFEKGSIIVKNEHIDDFVKLLEKVCNFLEKK